VNKLTTATVALGLATACSPALAQQNASPRVGVITGQGVVEVTVAKGKLWQQRGTSCLLRPGDRVSFIADVADAGTPMVVVHKQFDSRFRVRVPDSRVCIRGKDVFMSKAQFEAAESDYAKQKAEKEKTPTKKGKKGFAEKS